MKVRARKRLGGFLLDAEFESRAPVLGVFAPSGHGKTTLLRVLAGLLRPEQGEIEVDGLRLFSSADEIDLPARERGVGFCFQEPSLFPHLSVRENLLYGRLRRGSTGRERFSLEEAARVLELSELLDRRPDSLSGGESRRVAIGRALLSAPRLLLLDEPTAGLDLRVKERTLAWLKTVREAFAAPLLIVSHSLADILRLTRELVVLKEGKVAACGDAFEAMDRALIYELLRREGIVNMLDGTVEAAGNGLAVRLGTQLLKARVEGASPGDAVVAQLPARDILLAREPVLGLSARNALRGRLTRAAAVGDAVLCHIDIGQELVAEITPEALAELALAPGAEVYCIVKAQAISISAL